VRAGLRATLAEDRAKNDPRKAVLVGFSPHDVELGLVPGSELVSLTRDTVRTSDAPTVGHAMLEFQIDAAGIMVSGHVLDASSDSRRWEDVAAEIAKAARARTSKVSGRARGYAIKLEVTSELRTATGGTPTDSTINKVIHAVNNPLDAIVDGTVPVQRFVAARIVDVQVL
jgi:hypothetical protein